jgi:DNA-binding cell septation regulator SpoVG
VKPARNPSTAQLRRGEAATWGSPAREADREPRLKKWVSHRSGARLGFCSVQLASGMLIHDIRIMTGKNGLWCAMPAQRQLDVDGRPRLDANNKPMFNQIIEFKDRQTADRFNAMVIALVRAEHAEDLEDTP